MTKIAICSTTVFEIDSFLAEYTENIRRFGRQQDVCVLIAGDRKSPVSCKDVAEWYQKSGIDTRFLSIDWQLDYLRRFPDLGAIIPENSDNRRNVAYLVALEEGADIVISVDDDNFPLLDIDFVGEHLSVGTCQSLPQAVGKDGWFNLCSLLLPQHCELPDDRLYPRGFPYGKRQPGTQIVGSELHGRIGINVGLWTMDPDVDAIGRLYASPRIEKWDKRNILLGSGIRCPINTQNTALSREAMAAYYYIRMGTPLRGMRLDRFGDIFSGYFLQVCANAVGDNIRIGSPIAEHRRHGHNLLLDLYNELAGIMILEDMADFISTIHVSGDSYLRAYRDLSYRIEEFSNTAEGFIWQDETRDYFRNMGACMRIWADVVADLE